jgi:rhodanese-related sulfurtransferase
MNPPQLPDPASEIEVACADVARLAPQIGAGMVVLVDCREPHEWSFNHLPNSYHLPLGEIMGAKMVPSPLCGVPVIVYCHHGMRSLKAARVLRAAGHPAAFSMTGGIDIWSLEIDAAVPRY